MKKLKNQYNLFFILVLCIFLTTLLISCGGGSEGTGSASTTIEGFVKSSSGLPLENVLITLEETGENDLTDKKGNFEINTETEETDITLELSTDELSTSVEIENVTTQEEAVIEVEIEVNESQNEASISNFEFRAKLVGDCKFFFDKGRPIRQIADTDTEKIKCSAKVFTKSNGTPLPGVEFSVDFRRCGSLKWFNVANGITSNEIGSLGEGLANFILTNDREHCVYRILAKTENTNTNRVAYFIHTLTKQEYDAERG